MTTLEKIVADYEASQRDHAMAETRAIIERLKAAEARLKAAKAANK